MSACKDDRDPFPEQLNSPTILSDLYDKSVKAESNLIEAIPGTVIQYGHVWSSQKTEPTISDSRTQLGRNGEPVPKLFKSQVSDLTVSTIYHIRAYVQTSGGVVYGAAESFKTEPDYTKRLTKIIDDSLKNKGFGYSFIVSKKGVIVGSGAGGMRSRAIEYTGERPVTLDTKMQIASMSKTITAIAFMKLASEKGIKTNDRIGKFLPPSWKRGAGINDIRFVELMTHMSGIIGLGAYCQNGALTENYWYGLQNIVAKGVGTEKYQCYQNANYGLFRVLIPAILGYSFTGNDETDDAETQKIYENYVRENIMRKAQVSSPGLLYNSGEDPTYGYEYPYQEGNYGFNPGNFSSTAGAYGFYLSANEAAALYAKVFSTNDESIISAALKDSLLVKGLANYSALTPQGKFSYHDGWWYISYGGGRFQGFRSVWMKCPDDITVVMFTNSLRNGDGLFPIFSDYYSDITSYLLWTFSELDNRKRNGRVGAPVNFHKYLKNPEPH